MNRPLRGLLAALCLLPVALSAAEPTAGTLTPDSGPLTYTSGPFLVSDPSGECAIGVCDYYDLTVSIPAGALAGFPSASVKIVIEWGGPSEDYDLYVYDAAGGEVANSGSALTASESLSFLALEGDTVYQVEISPYAVTGGTVNATITFEPGEPGVVPGPGGPVEPGGVPLGASGPGIPRYLTYTPPPALNGNVGEPSIGFNTETKRAFLLSGFKTLWATFPAEQDPPAPEACEAEWEDRSFVTTTVNTLDPIGITDSLVRGAETNRTWIGQLQAKSHLMAFTDDDGETWTPSEGNSVVLNGFDHQTIGSGPYPEGMEILARTSFPNALYYCGQDVAYANCARSDDGGLTFGPTTIMYDLTTCAGLHGHARVAPDGTVYVPAPDCNGEAGVAISEDAGTTWRVSTVPGSEASGFDPQLAVASDGTGYMCFAKGLGQAFVSVTTDKGETWSDPVNISQELGIQHIAFPQAVAGKVSGMSTSPRPTTVVRPGTSSMPHRMIRFRGMAASGMAAVATTTATSWISTRSPSTTGATRSTAIPMAASVPATSTRSTTVLRPTRSWCARWAVAACTQNSTPSNRRRRAAPAWTAAGPSTAPPSAGANRTTAAMPLRGTRCSAASAMGNSRRLAVPTANPPLST